MQFIQEQCPEKYSVKQEVLAEIEKYTSYNTIIASSTSGLLITEIANMLNILKDVLVDIHIILLI